MQGGVGMENFNPNPPDPPEPPDPPDPPDPPYPNGTLLKGTREEIFLYHNGIRFYAPSPDILLTLGFDPTSVHTVSDAELNSIPQGANLDFPSFILSVNTIQCRETRSVHRDTLIVSVSSFDQTNILTQTIIPTLGDIAASTTWNVSDQLTLDSVKFTDPNAICKFVFHGYNQGHPEDPAIISKINDVTTEVFRIVEKYPEVLVLTALWDAIAVSGGVIVAVKTLITLFDALKINCDGPLFVKPISNTTSELSRLTGFKGSFRGRDTFEGDSSPFLCGAKSVYIVDWTIRQV
jgi:hypothetical protein